MKRLLLALVFVLSACLPSQAAIAFVNSVSQDMAAGGTTTAANMAGANFCAASVSWYNAGTPVLSDSSSNTWTFVHNESFFGTANSDTYYAKNATTTSSMTFTLSTNPGAITVICFSGVDTTAPFDTSNAGNTTGSATIQPGSVTPAAANSVVVTFSYFESGTVSINAPFTLTTQSVGFGSAGAYEIQTTATARNPTWTDSVSQTRINAQIMVFQVSAGGGTTCTPTLSLLGVGRCG